MAVRLRIEMRHILPQWILTCCTMRRRSLRLLSPNLCLNSDGDTGAFFRVKNYRRDFARKTLGLERAGIVPPSYLLEGTLQVKRDFHATYTFCSPICLSFVKNGVPLQYYKSIWQIGNIRQE